MPNEAENFPVVMSFTDAKKYSVRFYVIFCLSVLPCDLGILPDLNNKIMYVCMYVCMLSLIHI